MGKSDDSIARRKNRKSRSKKENQVSTRIAAIIASKKRRLTGKRRLCQGMCYSIPTLDDPFNENHGKVDFTKKKKSTDKKSVATKKSRSDDELASSGVVEAGKTVDNGLRSGKKGQKDKVLDCPTKFLIHCLNSIQIDLHHETAFSKEDRPFFVHKWGVEFWKFYSSGKDVIETSGIDSTLEQIAWIASCAADTITAKEKEGLSFSSPFLLFIVPSQEKAAQVRRICKPLKALGVHSVSLHPGASIDHQISGLTKIEPEFLLATPERLLELVSLNKVNISKVSLLVIDGLETYADSGILESIKAIKNSISGSPQTVVFSDNSSDLSTPVLRNLLKDSVCRMSLSDLIK